ncbi:hypothetical protein NMY22_g12221 [Coprinellus aureogranulatus]|nr:hypothetical protein NMY22_g12221 [Coprinellus aureogranulatus]
MRFTTLSSTTAVIVYLMSVTGSVSAVPIAVRFPSSLLCVSLVYPDYYSSFSIAQDALAARDMFDAELDIFEARQFHDLEDFDSREVDTALDPIYARFSDLDLDDLEARAPSPGSSNSVKQGIIIAPAARYSNQRRRGRSKLAVSSLREARTK